MKWMRWVLLASALLIASRFVAFRGSEGWDPLEGAPIWVFDHGYHAGLVLPRNTLEHFGGTMSQSWLTQFPDADWFEFGWGDAGFYFEVPSFDDVTFAIGVKALLLPSESVLHVATGQGLPEKVFERSRGVEILVTAQALTNMLAFVENGAVSDEPLGAGLYGVSAFYAGRGSYHLFQTCNSWVSQALRAGGLASVPGPSVLSSGLFWDLERRYGAKK